MKLSSIFSFLALGLITLLRIITLTLVLPWYMLGIEDVNLAEILVVWGFHIDLN
jgi:hypothetical protein